MRQQKGGWGHPRENFSELNWRGVGQAPLECLLGPRTPCSPDLGHVGDLQFLLGALLAAVAAAVLSFQRLCLDCGCSEVAPLPTLEDDLVAATENLKGFADLLHGVELDGSRFVEVLEVRWEDKVAHGNSVDVEAERLDRVGTL